MLVTTLDEGAIADIGHAFGYYDYGEESGLSSLFPSQEATAAYIRGYARGMLRGGFLHTNSPRQEGFLAFKRPGERLGLPTLGPPGQGLPPVHDAPGAGPLRPAHEAGRPRPG